MKAWTDMTAAEKSVAVLAAKRRGLTYSQTARELGTTKNAITGALARAEGRETQKKRVKRPGSRAGRKIGTKQHERHLWSEENLSEPWAVWSAKRKAARLAASKGKA